MALVLVAPLVLSACSSQSESSPSITPMVTESATPTQSEIASDPCAVLDQMQASLSTAVADLAANPDLVTAFEKEFDNQVAFLDDLIASFQGDSAEQQKLQRDLDAALSFKDEALNKFNEARAEDNFISKTLGLADAALSARDAVSAAELVLTGLDMQFQCS